MQDKSHMTKDPNKPAPNRLEHASQIAPMITMFVNVPRTSPSRLLKLSRTCVQKTNAVGSHSR
eukprot:1071125-Pyramimonas_sp.AAC.1